MRHRVGIIGTGDIAYYHAQAMQTMLEVELVAACDISAKALDAFAAEFSVPRCYGSLQELLDNETLDIAIICTWGALHKEQSNIIARSGKARAILCEKPISSTADECLEMARAAKENGVILIEAFKFRHHPQHLKVREIIESGRIGSISSIHTTFSSPISDLLLSSSWRFDRARGGGSIYDTASYCINACRYLVGERPQCVFARGLFGSSGTEESAALLIEYQGGVTAQISTSYRYCYSQFIIVYGTEAMIRMDMAFNLRQPMEWSNPSLPVSVEIVNPDLKVERIDFEAINDFGEQLEHLCRCLAGDESPRISLQESLDNMATIDAVHASMKTGSPVSIARMEI